MLGRQTLPIVHKSVVHFAVVPDIGNRREALFVPRRLYKRPVAKTREAARRRLDALDDPILEGDDESALRFLIGERVAELLAGVAGGPFGPAVLRAREIIEPHALGDRHLRFSPGVGD